MPSGTIKNSIRAIIMALGLAPVESGAEPLFQHAWTLTKEDVSEPLPSQIFLRLNADGGVSGNGGCNNFMGRFVTNSDAILFSPLAATRMYCDEHIMKTERSFLAAIEAARLINVQDDVLELRDAEGSIVVRLVPSVAK